MKRAIIGSFLAIIYSALLYYSDWHILMFAIPFLVGLFWVVWNTLEYSAQMEEMAEQVGEEWNWEIVEKDHLTYIKPKSRTN